MRLDSWLKNFLFYVTSLRQRGKRKITLKVQQYKFVYCPDERCRNLKKNLFFTVEVRWNSVVPSNKLKEKIDVGSNIWKSRRISWNWISFLSIPENFDQFFKVRSTVLNIIWTIFGFIRTTKWNSMFHTIAHLSCETSLKTWKVGFFLFFFYLVNLVFESVEAKTKYPFVRNKIFKWEYHKTCRKSKENPSGKISKNRVNHPRSHLPHTVLSLIFDLI